MNAAAYRATSDCSAATEYTAISTEGGISTSSVPAEATAPAAKAGSYPCLRISGMATRENVAAVAIDDPQMAPKSAHEPMVALARAPRKPEKTALDARNSSVAMPARAAT